MPRPGTFLLGTKIALPVLRTHVRCHIAPRLNRLPQRLDYTLIPAPLGELLWLNTKYVFLSCYHLLIVWLLI